MPELENNGAGLPTDEEMQAFISNLMSGPKPDVEAFERGKAELLALGDSIDPTFFKLMDLIVDWALEAQATHNLSKEGLCVLLETGPDLHSTFHAGMNDRKEKEANGGN